MEPPGRPRPWVKGETAVYHITYIENLASIVRAGQLDCDNGCVAAAIEPVSIAYSSLKEQRARTEVTVASGGTLADYVPFYYAPRSPMLYTIWRGNVIEYAGSQDDIDASMFVKSRCLRDSVVRLVGAGRGGVRCSA
jgi:ssDNA thymidine ADP-ribosyltransferase, DarT